MNIARASPRVETSWNNNTYINFERKYCYEFKKNSSKN